MTNHETISPAGGDNITAPGGDVENSLSFALPHRGSAADHVISPPEGKDFVLAERPKYDSLTARRVLRAPVCAAPKQTSRSSHRKSAAATTTTTVTTTAPGGEEADEAKWGRLRRALEAHNSDHLVAESGGYVVVDGEIIRVW
ncbi:hypothetical protein Slin14017_G032840 [Septoria linicola]|nr:hypothetical protein Slin14017_G032840 [Septoria linicola]